MMQDLEHPHPPVPPRERRWLYPFFEDIVDTIENHVTKDRSSMDPNKSENGPDDILEQGVVPQNAKKYTLQEGFLPEDRFWIQHVRDERMFAASNVLYRPKIVHDLVQHIEQLLDSNRSRGLMVKGPQGVGKSYSVINLTRYLLASGKYWVTIIPDCEKWIDEYSFFMFLLQSVGVDHVLFRSKYKPSGLADFEYLIADIDTVLSNHGMQWVFIFDQINRIFARKEFHDLKDIGVLPLPFLMMKQVLKPGRIISIISDSANNDLSYKDNHPGFDVFDHPIRFDEGEIKLLYPVSENWDEDIVEYETGYVPFYLSRWVKSREDHSGITRNEVKGSLEKLKLETGWDDIWKQFVTSAIQCVLRESSRDPPRHWDRKFLLVEREKPNRYKVVALFPLVEEAYSEFFWNQVSEYIDEHERALLDVCNDKDTSADVRGRLFERIVIRRLVRLRLSRADLKKILDKANLADEVVANVCSALQQGFKLTPIIGLKYPRLDSEDGITCFTPLAPNFPAVDLIIRAGNIVIVFQIHIAISHKEVLTLLRKKVTEARWEPKEVQKIILVYLSPTSGTRDATKGKIGRPASKQAWYTALFLCTEDLDSLRDLQWRDS